MMPKYKAGDKVEWYGHAAGSSRKHTGMILGVIRQWGRPRDVKPQRPAASSQDKTGYGWDGTSKLERYLIKVERIGKKGQQLPPHYYSPGTGKIDKQATLLEDA
jgi:hypothetical protein